MTIGLIEFIGFIGVLGFFRVLGVPGFRGLLGGPGGLSKSVIRRVIIRVATFRVLITLLITQLLRAPGPPSRV